MYSSLEYWNYDMCAARESAKQIRITACLSEGATAEPIECCQAFL